MGLQKMVAGFRQYLHHSWMDYLYWDSELLSDQEQKHMLGKDKNQPFIISNGQVSSS